MTHHARIAALAALVLVLPGRVEAAVVRCEAGDVLCLSLAIKEANATPNRETIIHLAAGVYALTAIDNFTDGPNGLPSIVGRVTITGDKRGGTILSRPADAPPLRIFHVGAPGQLSLEWVTVSNNAGQDPIGSMSFRPDFDGGGLFNNGGAVIISDTWFTENRAGRGGAIFSSNGIVRMSDSRVAENSVTTFLSGATSALLASGGTLELTRSVIEHNSSPFSGTGGVSTTGAEVRIIQSRFTGNSGLGTGALQVAGGNLSVSQTTFDRNAGNGANAVSLGGATGVVRDSAFVQNGGSSFYIGTTFFNSGTVDVINTTFAQNTIGERFSLPKGIAITNSGTMTIVNSTVAGSSAGFFIVAGAIFGSPQSTTILKNTILRAVSNSLACAGEITSLGNNLIEDLATCTMLLQSTDVLADAALGPLNDDGSPGNAHYPLLPASGAIDAADSRACTKKDQIGRPRVPRCDIGAVEAARVD